MKLLTPKKFDVFLADLNPRFGSEPGKIRPVVVVQTNLLNDVHPSVIICPFTTNITKTSHILRIHLAKSDQPICGIDAPSDILVDQIRAIDKKRLVQKIGHLPREIKLKLIQALKIIIIN